MSVIVDFGRIFGAGTRLPGGKPATDPGTLIDEKTSKETSDPGVNTFKLPASWESDVSTEFEVMED